MGVIPLLLATGSGAAARATMGAAVFFGMLVATIVGVFIYPALFVLIEALTRKRKTAPIAPPVSEVAAAGSGH
jgi:HAE1 family hydrophobic/amphiphilic exporter-1